MKAEAKLTSSNQKHMIVVQFKVLNGPYANRVVFNNFVISPESSGAMRFFFQHMNALGFTKDYFAQEPSTQRLAEDMKGRRVRVTVGTRVYNDRETNEVKNVKPLQGMNGATPVVPAAAAATPPPPPAPKPKKAEAQASAPAPAPQAKADGEAEAGPAPVAEDRPKVSATAAPPAVPF